MLWKAIAQKRIDISINEYTSSYKKYSVTSFRIEFEDARITKHPLFFL